MATQRDTHLRLLLDGLLTAPGDTERSFRQAVLDGKPPAGALGSFAVKVAHDASRITDDDVKALQTAGQSDDAIFEAILLAATAAGLERLDHGLRALGKSREKKP